MEKRQGHRPEGLEEEVKGEEVCCLPHWQVGALHTRERDCDQQDQKPRQLGRQQGEQQWQWRHPRIEARGSAIGHKCGVAYKGYLMCGCKTLANHHPWECRVVVQLRAY